MKITIDRLAYGGDGVARPVPDEPVIFVPRAAAHDELDVEIVEEKPRFRRARILSVLRPGPDRAEPPCGYYQGDAPSNSCGGCQYQHLAYEAQFAAKVAQVGESLRRIGGLDVGPPPVGRSASFRAPNSSLGSASLLDVRPGIPAPRPLGYRNKGTFHWNPSEGRFGLVASDGHTVMPIGSCPLLTPDADRVYRAASDVAAELATRDAGVRRALVRLVVRAGATGETMVVLVTRPGGAESLAEPFTREVIARSDPSTVLLNVNPNPEDQLFGTRFLVTHGSGTIQERIGEVRFVADAETFLQVNTDQAAALFRVAADASRLGPSTGGRVLDLYCGNGGIALTVAPRAATVVGVESVAAAVERGRESALLNGIENVEFRAGRVESALERLRSERFEPDVVFLDPPRAGVKPQVVAAVSKMRPGRIVYVSCNPTTLARDLKLFAGNGYRVVAVTPVDLFPQTFHVEAVAELERMESK